VIESFEMTELVHIFRSGLLALLPVMDAARIRWAEPGVYDPWEEIERTLFSSIVRSCVENAMPGGSRPLATHGLNHEDYEGRSFLSGRNLRMGGKSNALVELQTRNEPFDTVLLRNLDANLMPAGQVTTKPIGLCTFDLAARVGASVGYRSRVAYQT
jgi:hypothetical protein